uniref:SET domain-containing protein n=1 Tax=Magallana gigas TaxID=29159 RepID=A0A8W8LWL2_MAGGI
MILSSLYMSRGQTTNRPLTTTRSVENTEEPRSTPKVFEDSRPNSVFFIEPVAEESEQPSQKCRRLFVSVYRKGYNKEGSVDASEEDGRLGRLVNHGSKKEINCKMKLIGEVLCLFGTRDIYEGEELLYDYGLKFYPWNSKTNHLPLRDHSVCPISLLHLLT